MTRDKSCTFLPVFLGRGGPTLWDDVVCSAPLPQVGGGGSDCGGVLVHSGDARPVTLHPFASVDIPAGAELSEDMFDYREIPAGLLPSVAVHGRLTVGLSQGDPLTSGVLADLESAVPDGWWAVELEAPPGLLPGSRALLVAGGRDGVSPARTRSPVW